MNTSGQPGGENEISEAGKDRPNTCEHRRWARAGGKGEGKQDREQEAQKARGGAGEQGVLPTVPSLYFGFCPQHHTPASVVKAERGHTTNFKPVSTAHAPSRTDSAPKNGPWDEVLTLRLQSDSLSPFGKAGTAAGRVLSAMLIAPPYCPLVTRAEGNSLPGIWL